MPPGSPPEGSKVPEVEYTLRNLSRVIFRVRKSRFANRKIMVSMSRAELGPEVLEIDQCLTSALSRFANYVDECQL